MSSSDDDDNLERAIALSLQRSRSASPAPPVSHGEVTIWPKDNVVRDQTRREQPVCSICQHLSVKYHSFHLADLQEQFQECELCTLLWNGITAALGTALRNVMTNVDIWHRGLEGDGPLVISVRYHEVWNRILQFYRTKDTGITIRISRVLYTERRSDSFVPWPEIGFSPEVGSSGISECTISRAKQWLRGCDDQDDAHRDCWPYDAKMARLPRRVIHVGTCDGDLISLYVTNNGEVGRYIALSHCWGDKKLETITTTENYHRHLQEIPLPLPLTFMDAVRVTRALGVPYLWIDSLCIVQDSTKDWNEQAPEMSIIYVDAYCTISADAAESPFDGFVDGSRRSKHTPHKVKFTYGGEGGTVLVRARATAGKYQTLHDFSPLSFHMGPKRGDYLIDDGIALAGYSRLYNRAWVFQERVRSRRTLHFGHSESSWECRSLVDCECSPYRTAYGRTRTDISRMSLKSMVDVWNWSDVISHYSKLRLSVSSDRLVALSGLAKDYFRKTGDVYMAGIWASKIKDGLLWTVEHCEVSGCNNCRPPTRLDIAPTWSWASVEGDVTYSKIGLRHTGTHEDCCLDWTLVSFHFSTQSRTQRRADLWAPSIRACLKLKGLLVDVVIDDPQIADTDSRNAPMLYRLGIMAKDIMPSAIKQPWKEYLYRISPLVEEILPADLQHPVRSIIYWDILNERHENYTLFITSRDRDDRTQGQILFKDGTEYKRCGMFSINPWGRGPFDIWTCWLDYIREHVFRVS